MKKIFSIILSLLLIVGSTLPNAAAENAPLIVLDEKTVDNSIVRQIKIDEAGLKGMKLSDDEFLRILGFTEKEIQALLQTDKNALLNSSNISANISHYKIDSYGIATPVSQDVAELGATQVVEQLHSGVDLHVSDEKEDPDGYIRVSCYTAKLNGTARRNKTIVTVVWLTDPAFQIEEVIGIAISGNFEVLHTTIAGGLSYTKKYNDLSGTTITSEYDPFDQELTSYVGSDPSTNCCYTLDLPSDTRSIYTSTNYTDFVVTLSCEAELKPGYSGEQSHYSSGYYIHSKRDVDITASMSLTVSNTGITPPVLTLAATLVDNVIEVKCPVRLVEEY